MSRSKDVYHLNHSHPRALLISGLIFSIAIAIVFTSVWAANQSKSLDDRSQAAGLGGQTEKPVPGGIPICANGLSCDKNKKPKGSFTCQYPQSPEIGVTNCCPIGYAVSGDNCLPVEQVYPKCAAGLDCIVGRDLIGGKRCAQNQKYVASCCDSGYMVDETQKKCIQKSSSPTPSPSPFINTPIPSPRPTATPPGYGRRSPRPGIQPY